MALIVARLNAEIMSVMTVQNKSIVDDNDDVHFYSPWFQKLNAEFPFFSHPPPTPNLLSGTSAPASTSPAKTTWR